MNSPRDPKPEAMNPDSCRHLRFQRIGIQRAPVPPHRLYLMTCRVCGTTLATASVRRLRSVVPAGGDDDGSADDRDDEGPGRNLPRRRAG
jgi:hypothetical protein